jgi:peptide-methionine (S)-S-oxide reductase
MNEPAARQFDQLFRQAVAAIDNGDLDALRRLLASHPELASARLEAPGQWLRDEIGAALDGFFARPYLLWFVSEDVKRHGRLPPNIADIARVIIDAAKDQNAPTLQDQLDSTLALVSWSGVAADAGLQIPLLDVLIDAGARPAMVANNALVNGHVAAAAHLVSRGGELTLASALCLDRWSDVPALADAATVAQRQFALVLAALNGKARAVAWLIDFGVPIDEPSPDLYSHGRPLHHAICSGSLDTVRTLAEAGADLDRPDTAWNGTPLGWAAHYVEDGQPERRPDYLAIYRYLKDARARR